MRAQSRVPERTLGYRFHLPGFSRQISAVSSTISMTADHSRSIITSIQSSLGAEKVAAGTATDAIDGLIPDVVASPSNNNELCSLLSLANEEGYAVAPRGGGTQLGLGNRPEKLDIVADISSMNRVVQHNAADLTLAVEAGITLSSLREILAAEGQFLPLDAPLPERATIGGTLASGVSGPLKWQYGSARDLVIGMKVAQANGRITQSGGNVVKNVSGYDMARLHVGGLGTLGIITEVSFKLTPMPRHEATLLARFDSATACLSAALGIFNSGVMPIAMTAFDGGTCERILDDSNEDVGYALAVRLGGRPRTLGRMENEALVVIREYAERVDKPEDEAKGLWSHLADFGYLGDNEAIASARIATLPNNLAEVAEALSGSGEAAVVAQPGYGMMSAHWFTDADPADEIRSLRQVVHGVGGSLIVERAPLSVKEEMDVWDYTGESIAVMRRLKEQYDPSRILNPNRFAGGI